METGENQAFLGALLHQQINTAMQVLLNQGQEVINAVPSALDKKMPYVFQILSKTNPKIQSLEYLESEPEQPDCPLYFGNDQRAVMFDWTLSYLCIDAACGGINGLSIEKRRFDMYSTLEKKLLHVVLNKLAQVLDIAETAVILDKKPALKFYYFGLKTPQTTGVLGLALPMTTSEKGPTMTGDDIPLPFIPTIAKMNVPLADVCKWKKGTYLPLSEQNNELILTWTCQEAPIATGSALFTQAEEIHVD